MHGFRPLHPLHVNELQSWVFLGDGTIMADLLHLLHASQAAMNANVNLRQQFARGGE